VYIDDFRVPWRGRSWSHLTADTAEELHEFAAALGIPSRGFHHNPERPWKDHYDCPEQIRARALELGATPIGRREAADRLRAKRDEHRAAAPDGANDGH
jgi:Ser/Thr protein kinase RdoA (MazF antagonist)